MPTYAYRCPNGHEYEKLQKISDTTHPECPNCGKPGERLISGGAGVVFKGSGFYETDYKRASGSPDGAKSETPKESESTPAEGGDKKSSKKADSGADS